MEKNKVLSNAFLWLFIGLLLCFGVSITATFSRETLMFIYMPFGMNGIYLWAIAEIVIALILSFGIRKLSPLVAKIFYLLYCAITGVCLTGIFLVYTESSIAFVFLATAITFGIFALIGKYTKIDLSKWWVYLLTGLLAVIILEIVNIFIMNNTLNMILCIASILIFCGYIAYDIQRALDENFLSDCENKGIYIAFQLFLDIINIFIDLLRLFGKARDN